MALDRQGKRSETLASSASEQVRAIIEASETIADEIRRDAEADAKEIRDAAHREAQESREQANAQTHERVGNVSEATDAMLTRLDAMQSELDLLVEQLRAGSDRLGADLKLLQDNLTEMNDQLSPARSEPEADPAADSAPVASVTDASAGGADEGEDAEGARLIALNMALNGAAREETATYLEENFALTHADGLLDEVYASVER